MPTRVVFQDGGDGFLAKLKKPIVFIPLGIVALVAVVIVVLLIFTSGSSSSTPMCLTNDEKDDVPLDLLARGNEMFTDNLFKAMMKENDEENVVVSPFSISSVLAMASVGAQGETQEELRNILRLPCDESSLLSGFESLVSVFMSKASLVSTANGLFVDEAFEPNKTLATKLWYAFNSSVTTLPLATDNVAAAKTINSFVAEATKDKIKDLIDSSALSADTKMLLINAVYFKGKWKLPFKPESTKPKVFRAKGKSVTVDMMEQTENFEMADFDEAQVLRMRYHNESPDHQMAMYIVLPSNTSGIGQIMERENFIDALNNLQFGRRQTHVMMPKFKLKQTYRMEERLQKLGLEAMFKREEADFSAMLNTMDNRAVKLFVDLVVHAATVEVDEEGTEAAAATGVGLRATSFRDPTDFICDKPFIFVLRHETLKMTLFAGALQLPNSK